MEPKEIAGSGCISQSSKGGIESKSNKHTEPILGLGLRSILNIYLFFKKGKKKGHLFGLWQCQHVALFKHRLLPSKTQHYKLQYILYDVSAGLCSAFALNFKLQDALAFAHLILMRRKMLNNYRNYPQLGVMF